MSKNDKDKTEDGQPAAGAADEAANGNGATPWADGAEAAAQAGAEEEAALRADNDKLKDQLLRALAEMENLRQRTQRELAETRSYAVAGFARDMLSVSDNLRRALDALPDETGEDTGDATLKTLREGVEMTERSLQQILEKHQVRRIEPKGERFDPNFHQAMFEIKDKDTQAGTVVEVAQAGYVIGERVLRPAMVGVAKGGPKPDRPAADEAAPAPDAAAQDMAGEAEPSGEAPQAPPEPPAPEKPAGNSPVGAKVDKSA